MGVSGALPEGVELVCGDAVELGVLGSLLCVGGAGAGLDGPVHAPFEADSVGGGLLGQSGVVS